MTITNIEEALEASFFLPYSLGALALLCTCVYVTSVARWVLTWRKNEQCGNDKKKRTPVSVVIALHNEEENVGKMLKSLMEQTETIDEVVLVADHCTDGTESRIKEIIEENQHFNARIVRNEGEAGKKNAQRLGVSEARNEYVAVIDGDCKAEKHWYETMATTLAEKKPDMLIMPVRMKANNGSIAQELMELEFVSLQLSTAATAMDGHPTMCNGANMAFKKEVYMGHDSRLKYASGDDMFLLSAIKQNGGRIEYLKSDNAAVETTCPNGIKAYYYQRTRWLRKATGYTDKDVKKLAMTVAFGNAAWPTMVILTAIGTGWIGLGCFILKTVSEMILLWQGRDVWQHKWNVVYIIMLALAYPFVLLSIAILTIFRDKKKW